MRRRSCLWDSVEVDFSKRAWYLLAIALPVAGWLMATAHLAGQWDQVRDAQPIPIGAAIDAKGSSVLAFTDLERPDQHVECTTAGPKKHRKTFSAPPVEVVIDSDGSRWHLIGILEKGEDSMRLRCAPEGGGTDAADYAYAVIPAVSDRTTSARVIGWGSLGFGFAIALIVGHNRYRKLVSHV